MKDEITNLNKQNGSYRQLILSNEEKLQALLSEVEDLQSSIKLQKQSMHKYQDETEVYK